MLEATPTLWVWRNHVYTIYLRSGEVTMSEALRALHDGTLKLEERLKVACHVARNGNPDLLESKVTFLVKWACEELCNAYSKKSRSHPNTKVCSQLWQFLDTMLECQHHNSRQQRHLHLQESQAPISVHLVQAMRGVMGLRDARECVKPVLSCLEHILKSLPLPSVLYKFEVVASLLLSVLIIAGCKESIEDKVMERENELSLKETVLCLMLDHFNYLQGTQGNQKKVFTTICNQLLPPVITLRCSSLALSSCGDLGHKLDALLHSLFSRDHLTEYTSALSHYTTAVPTGRRSAVSYTKLLFESLQTMLKSQDSAAFQAVLSVIPLLFESFLQQNGEGKKLSKGTEFQFFLTLVFLLGFPVTLTTADSHSVEKENSKSKSVRKGKEGAVRKGRGVEDGEEMDSVEEEEKEEDGLSLDREMTSIDDHDSEEGEEEEGEEKEEEDGKEKEFKLDWDVLLARVLREEGLDSKKELGGQRRFSNPVLKILANCLHLLKRYVVYEAVRDHSNGNRQFDCLRSLCIEVVKTIDNSNLLAVAQCLEEFLQLNHKLVEPHLAGLLLLATTTSNLTKRMGSFVQKCIDIYSKLHQLNVLVEKLFLALEKMAMSSFLPTTISPIFSKSSEYWFCKHVQDLPVGQSLTLMEQLTHSLRSIFLAKIQLPCITGKDEIENQRRKKRRLSNRKKAELSTFEVSPCFVVALSRGINVLSLVLVNTPVSVWCSEGMHRGRAMATLLAVQKDVCVPLMKIARTISELATASLSLAHSLQNLLFCLRDMRPVDTLSPSTDGTSQESVQFVSNEMRAVWNEGLGHPIPEVWMEEERRPFDITSIYFLRAMSMAQLRFQKDCHSQDTVHLLDFIFEEVDSAAFNQGTAWSGQPLDVNDKNFSIAVWDLALSNLPLLYRECLPTHLKNVASFLYSALLHESIASRGDENEGQTVHGVALGFLHSASFQDMRMLHELLLSTCFERAATTLPKSLKEMKRILLSCSGELLDSSVHLKGVLEQQGLQLLQSGGEDNSIKRRKSVLKTAQHLSVFLEVMRVIPTAFTYPELLHRCCLVLTISHIGLVHSLQPPGQESLRQLSEVQLALARVLLSLVHRDRAGKKKTPHLSPLPFDQLLMWLYTAAQHCIDLVEDKDSQFRVSSLLVLEAALESALKSGSYPTCFTQQIVSYAAKTVTDTDEPCSKSLLLSVLQLMVTKICKVYSDLKPSQRNCSFLHEPLIQLLQETAKPLSNMRKNGPERVQLYPQLVSSFCLLIRTVPPPHISNLSKSLKMAKFLFNSFCSDEILHSAINNPSILFSVIDCLSLPIIGGDTQHFAVTESWYKLFTLFQTVLNQDLDENGSYLVQLCSGGVDGTNSLGCESIANRVVPLLRGAMTQLLASANREQTTSMFQLLHKESCDSVEAAMAVCYCWSVILTAKFQPESQRELRKWHIKILLQCEALAIQHRGIALVIIMSLNITTHLVGLPTRVGLDSRLVLMSLHQTAVLQSIPEIKSLKYLVMQSIGKLLFTVLKNHSTVAASCPGPLVTAINKLVVALLQQGTGGLEGGEGCRASVANTISRIFDHLAGQQEFTRHVSCILSSYVAAIVNHPPVKTLKTALLPGVYSLLRHCTEENSAFIQASLDSTARLHYQSLLEDFKKQKRYL